MFMMRSSILAMLGLLAMRPVNCEADFSTSPIVQKRGDRMLQGNATSSYTAIWYFVHEGSCATAPEPNIILSCDGGDGIQVDTQSDSVTCTSVDNLSVDCSSAAGSSSGHAVDFTCKGDTLDEITAKATIPEQVEDCLGGDQLAAEWGHGLLLSLICYDRPVLNGTCTPLNTTFPDDTCTSGWSCPIGNCTVREYTISAMTSTVSVNDCSPYEAEETSGSIIGAVSTTGLAVAAALTMILGGW